MKTMILNASPRKNWNTAQLLRSAAEGAQSVGAEVEYIDLYDLNFTGCRSCLACKRKGARTHHCFWPDDLSPVIDRIYAADAVIIGSPIYLSDTTSQFHALFERLVYTNLSYGTPHPFQGKVNLGVILPMNASEEWFRSGPEEKVMAQIRFLSFLNGETRVMTVFDTLQVNDYSKYDMTRFDPDHKKQVRETRFPEELEKAFRMGAELSQG